MKQQLKSILDVYFASEFNFRASLLHQPHRAEAYHYTLAYNHKDMARRVLNYRMNGIFKGENNKGRLLKDKEFQNIFLMQLPTHLDWWIRTYSAVEKNTIREHNPTSIFLLRNRSLCLKNYEKY